ncbi:AAA family ATPase [uncultured Thiodictyon sp.]|uniref:AAA family ATPase n=1 Tax=uncultured Thiodictyon sp. TaxID=1846217 RepID=UPI00344251A7
MRGLDLDGLGRVNILIGANDSGKTSVLEALSILCKPYDPGERAAMIRRRDFGGLGETITDSLRWCFTQISGLCEPDELFSGRCELQCEGRFPLRKLTAAYSEHFEQRARVFPPRLVRNSFAEAPQIMREPTWCMRSHGMNMGSLDRFAGTDHQVTYQSHCLCAKKRFVSR